jgi:hypothetical protein
MYSFSVCELNRDRTLGQRIFQQPLDSAEDVDALKNQLLIGDAAIERKLFYFPHVQQVMKIENACLRVLVLMKNFFLDLVTFPYRVYTYGKYKNELKQELPIYQYLRNHNVPQKYLDKDRFAVFFFSGEKPATSFVREEGLLRKIVGDKFDPTVFQDRNFQEYNKYQSDVYYGMQHTSYGLTLLTEEVKTKLSQPFVTS